MGVYSTVVISRENAIEQITNIINSSDTTNEQLADCLFALTQDSCLDNYGVLDTEEKLAIYNKSFIRSK